MRKARGRRVTWAIVGLLASSVISQVLVPGGSALAQNFSVLYNFGSVSNDGSNPNGTLVEVGALLYGATFEGGTNNNDGTVFSFDPDTNTEAVIHSFSGGSGDGTGPSSNTAMVVSGNMLYGTTTGGGANGQGTVFGLNTANNQEGILYSFGNGTDGVFPVGGLTLYNNHSIYGTTEYGGGPSHLNTYGTIFSIDLNNSQESLDWAYDGSADAGQAPITAMTQMGSLLYGTTIYGGKYNRGTIFSFDPNTGAKSTLYSFMDGSDGAGPQGQFVASGSILYGTSFGSPNSWGTLFAFDTSDDSMTILHGFAGGNADGGNPLGSVILSGNMLYGMTSQGGSSPFAGTIYSYDIANGNYSILHHFDSADGNDPSGNLLLVGNTLYGMTPAGGNNNEGVIFSLAIPEPPLFSLMGCVSLVALGRHRSRCTDCETSRF